MHFRSYWRLRGAHVHAQLFVGATELAPHALSGTLSMREAEWQVFAFDLPIGHEVVDENAPWGTRAGDSSDPNYGRACGLCGAPIRAGERYAHECPKQKAGG